MKKLRSNYRYPHYRYDINKAIEYYNYTYRDWCILGYQGTFDEKLKKVIRLQKLISMGNNKRGCTVFEYLNHYSLEYIYKWDVTDRATKKMKEVQNFYRNSRRLLKLNIESWSLNGRTQKERNDEGEV